MRVLVGAFVSVHTVHQASLLWLLVALMCGCGGHARAGAAVGFPSRPTAAASQRPPAAVRAVHRRTLATGWDHTCALKHGGAVWCWGGDEFGEIGDAVVASRREDRHTPTPVVGPGSDVIEITAQGKHTCARKADATLWCWGRARAGDFDHPVQIAASTSVDDAPSCVVRTDGRIWCHGYNGHGELGDGTTVSRESPAPVITLEPAFDAVYLGLYHVLARKVDGTLWGWGANESGQIGDDTRESRRAPVEISTLGADVEEVVAGTSHSCARKRDGTVWCWGSNHHGELGDGTAADRGKPAAVVDLGSGVIEIAAGLRHTCARKEDGEIWCWGFNAHGQVGDGSTDDQTRPARIVGSSRDN